MGYLYYNTQVITIQHCGTTIQQMFIDYMATYLSLKSSTAYMDNKSLKFRRNKANFCDSILKYVLSFNLNFMHMRKSPTLCNFAFVTYFYPTHVHTHTSRHVQIMDMV